MLWTLYRYIVRDLLKLLILSTAVLVVMISFAAAVKPLADGLLGPWTLIKFVIYTIPTVLGLALPFAGAFASTLVFSRMANDNEVTACLASGISYVKILTPVIALGLCLTLGLFALSNFVVPTFFRWASQTVQSDFVSVLVNQLQQQHAFVAKDHSFAIYADKANRKTAPKIPGAAVQPTTYVQLHHMAAVRFGTNGSPQREVTAESAKVFLFQKKHRSWVTIRLQNVLFYDPATGNFAGGKMKTANIWPITIPQPLSDNPKFLSWSQLNELDQHPFRAARVSGAKHHLQQVLIDEQLLEKIKQALSSSPAGQSPASVSFSGPDTGEIYRLSAPNVLKQGSTLHLSATKQHPVVVVDHNPSGSVRRYEADSATLSTIDTETLSRPEVQMLLNNVRILDPSDPGNIVHNPKIEITSLTWPHPIHIDKPLRQAASQSHTPAVKAAVASLHYQLIDLARDILAQRHFRAASAVSCLLLLLMGAIMSMKLTGQMPLVVYFWSFIQAIITLLIINAGTHMTSHHSSPLMAALVVLWLGNILLAVVSGAMYCWLAKH